MSSMKLNPNRRSALKLAGAAAGAALLSRVSRASANRRSTSLRTRLSIDLGLTVPLASAGMAFVGLTDLAAAVSNAGALGVYGVGPEPPPVVQARLEAIQEQTSGPYGLDFLVDTGAFGPFVTQDHIDLAASFHVPVVVFHWNLPDASWVTQLHAAGSKVWMQTGDLNVALQAVARGVDGIVAQGRSAGGHNRNSTTSTWRVVHEMRRALPSRIFILAAGGVSDGRSLVRAIRAGADGGWAGTVFAAATESYAHPDYKARLVAAHAPHDTLFTTRFGPEWAGQQQRVLRNRATTEAPRTTPAVIGSTTLFPGVVNAPYEMPKYSAIVPTRDTVGDLEEMDMPAGSKSVRSVRAIRPAADIIADFIDDARDACDRDDEQSLDDD
jgi:NAD(P)H-dependent flavin oxidoreductase YrpB (nitropropane dioxygenase family)